MIIRIPVVFVFRLKFISLFNHLSQSITFTDSISTEITPVLGMECTGEVRAVDGTCPYQFSGEVNGGMSLR